MSLMIKMTIKIIKIEYVNFEPGEENSNKRWKG